MQDEDQSGGMERRGVGAHLGRALRRALVLFVLLAAGVVAVAVLTDGRPHLPFDYAGFD